MHACIKNEIRNSCHAQWVQISTAASQVDAEVGGFDPQPSAVD